MRPAPKRVLGVWALAAWAAPASADPRPDGLAAGGGAVASAPAPAWRTQNREAARAPRLAARDSARAHDQARRLQARLERRRLRESPRALGGSRPCDEVVGRLCVWHGDEPGALPAEPPAVGSARTRLLADLDSLARRVPGDHWVFGQRIRYMAEAGRLADAVRLARACGLPESWRCDAYLGFAHHESGDAQSAEAAFRAALEEMPPDRARRWTDLEPVLDAGLRRWLEANPDSAAAAERLWTLADPLFLAKGNDRRAGHLSRWTYAMSAERSWSPHQMRWGDDLTEVVVRYGWPVAWEQSWPTAGRAGGSAVGRDAPGARRTFPPRAVLEPRLGRPVAWPRPPAGGQATYVPPFLDSIGALDGQTGRFWRPGAVLVVAAARVPDRHNARSAAPAALAGLFLVHDGRVAMEAWRPARPGEVVRLSGSAPVRGTGVVSLETWIPAGRAAHRMRLGTALPGLLPGVLAMSDLVFLEPSAEPGNVLEAIGGLRSHAVYQGTDSINLAFEVYGVDGPQETVSLAAWVEGEAGLLSRLARWLRIGGPRRAAAVEWSEPGPPAPGPLFRALRIRLPDLPPGAYHLTVEASARGKAPVRRIRRLVVEPPSPPWRQPLPP